MTWKKIFVCFCALFSSHFLYAKEILIPKVVVQGTTAEEKPVDPDLVFKTERVSKDKLKSASRQNLNDVVKDQIGVESQSYCANCGAKRLTINGLKGEHTSILIDGLPLHSAVSSFYGVDNIPTNGLSEVQVMRGAGASLTNPEAIGGTLNLISVDPLEASSSYGTSVGFDDHIKGKSQNHNLLYGWQASSKKWGLVLGGQFARVETWDVDENNVAESPQREAYSLMAKTRFTLGSKNDFSARWAKSNLEILGGPAHPQRPYQIRPVGGAGEADFLDGDVAKEYIGDLSKITDWVEVDRDEVVLKGSHHLPSDWTLDWGAGHARQEQQAIYQHGFDYAHVDHLFVLDANLKHSLGAGHLLTMGVFTKDQRLRSASEVLFEQYPEGSPLDISKDNFNFSSYAAYLQYSYFVQDLLELDLALRADQVHINWLELTNEIQELVVAPRFQVLHHLSHHLTQRFSYGLGYRAPLTFFESQHGNNESGYEVDIEKMEKAHSLVYSLSFNTPDYYITGGLHYTHLKDMAYGFESFNQPILYRNSEESYDIWVSDLLLGYQVRPWWLIEASVELFQYEKDYKRKLPTAAIEERYQIKSMIKKGRWQTSLLFNMIGGRQISEYGSYDEHYVQRNQSSEPVLDPSLELKNQTSPTYFTLDASLSYQLSEKFVFKLGVNNIFDYTQTGEGSSPAAWHWHFNHAHYDQLHTWGPNRGREFVLSLSGSFG